MVAVIGIVFFSVLGLAVSPAFFWVAGLFFAILLIAALVSD